jgi:hypothetical protein
MKLKLNLLAAAAAVVALVAPVAASAATAATNLELLLVAFDGSGATTKDYIRDLGVSAATIGTSDLSFGAPVGSLFSTAFTGVASSNIYWGVIAIDAPNSTSYTTGALAKLTAAGLGSFDQDSNVGVGGIIQNSLNALVTSFQKTPTTLGEYYGAAQLSGSNGVDLIGNLVGGGANAVVGKGTGTSLNFFKVDGQGTPSQINANAGLSAFNGNSAGGYFTLAADGSVTYTGAAAVVSAVPLPAAALLFGPGLLAMFGVSRRRQAA